MTDNADTAAHRITARFFPEQWINDNAVSVDPEGEDEWDASVAFAQMPDDYRARLLEKMEAEDDAVDTFDWLKTDPNAPEWVRGWGGPFTIKVRQSVRRLSDTEQHRIL